MSDLIFAKCFKTIMKFIKMRETMGIMTMMIAKRRRVICA